MHRESGVAVLSTGARPGFQSIRSISKLSIEWRLKCGGLPFMNAQARSTRVSARKTSTWKAGLRGCSPREETFPVFSSITKSGTNPAIRAL